MAESNLTAQRLRELLSYNAGTGIFTWRAARGSAPAGRIAGTASGGYLLIRIDRALLKAHRLAWLYAHGVWPRNDIDHINGIRSDNRLANLRDVSRQVNIQNRRGPKTPHTKTGVLGAYTTATVGIWRSAIKDSTGKHHHLGHFGSPEEANAAYVAAKRRLHEGCTI